MKKEVLPGITFPKGLTQVRRLGEGYNSEVWAASEKGSADLVALKASADGDPSRHLEREFSILKRLNHPGIIKVREFGTGTNYSYFTMEFVEGKPFDEFFAEKRQDAGFLDLFAKVLGRTISILSYIHNQGIVHADVKPSNLLVRSNGKPVLLDFGFAEDYVLDPTDKPRGTIDYVAPELFLGADIGPAVDLYSLGVMAYEVITGRRLWEQESPRLIASAKLRHPQSLQVLGFDLPSEFEELILRLLDPCPTLRPSSNEAAAILSKLSRSKETPDLEPSGFPPAPVFSGREGELDRLKRMLFEDKRAVILEGPEGIGKTRLITELRFRALLERRNVLLFQGRQGYLSVLDHIVSTLGITESVQGQADLERKILEVVEKSGLDVLLLDLPRDVAPFELSVLASLARTLDKYLGVLIAGIDKSAFPEAQRLSLEPLKENDLLEMVSRTFTNMDKPQVLAKTLLSASGGNPRRITELLDLLWMEKWLKLERKWVYLAGPAERALATKLDAWLDTKMSAYKGAPFEILNTLALADEPVPSKALESLYSKTKDSITFRGFLDGGLVRSVKHKNDLYYEIENDLIRNYVLGKTSEQHKRLQAAKLASAIEQDAHSIWKGDLDSWDDAYVSLLASLYVLAQDEANARRYLFEISGRLMSTHNFERAKAFLDRLLRFDLPREEKKEVLLELGRISDMQKDIESAGGYYSQAIDLVKGDRQEEARMTYLLGLAYQRAGAIEQSDDLFDLAENRLEGFSSPLRKELIPARGWNKIRLGMYAEAEVLFRQILEEESLTPEEQTRNLYNLAWTLFLKGSSREAMQIVKKIMESAETGGEITTAYQAALLASETLKSSGKLKEAHFYSEKALAFARMTGTRVMISQALYAEAGLLSLKGENRRARSLLNQATEIIERFTPPDNLLSVLSLEVYLATLLGEWRYAWESYLKLWKRFARVPGSYLKSYVLLNWADMCRMRGKQALANRMLAKASAMLDRNEYPGSDIAAEIVKCNIALDSDDVGAARRILQNAAKSQKRKQDLFYSLGLSALECSVLLKEAKNEKALITAKQMRAKIDASGLESMRGEVMRMEGQALIALGDHVKGLLRLRQSAEILERQENAYQHGITLFVLASSLFSKNGYSDEALAILDDARVIFERLGAELELKKLNRFRAEHFSRWREQKGLAPQYLEGFKRISELINYRLGEEDFMIQVLAVILELTSAARGIIFLHEDSKLYAVASKQTDAPSRHEARRISETVMRRITQGLEPIYTADATTDWRFNRSKSLLLNEIRSILCIPLKTSSKLLGTIYLDSPITGLFDPENAAYFESLGNILAATIDKSSEFAKMREEIRLTRERRKWEKSGVVLGNAASTRELYSQIERAARSEANVLLEGETGTGKGVMARLIHEKSLRRGREFCSINSGIVPENLFEAELFGYHKGSFTGALESKIGLLEAADGSTVFFDEITNTSSTMQAKLLEVIEERVIRRLGESSKRRINVRFIFATNKDLEKETREGRFREDLYYRINTFRLYIPPLRERKEDIPELCRLFVERSSLELNKQVNEIGEDVMEAFLAYPWPGNIRELANVLERAVILARGKRITKEFLDQRFFPAVPFDTQSLKDARKIEEEELIRRILLETRGNVSRAAKHLGISRQHLSRLITRYGIARTKSL